MGSRCSLLRVASTLVLITVASGVGCSNPQTPLLGLTSSSGGATGGGGTGGSDRGCAPGAVWRGDLCARLSCADAPLLAHCVLSDGGLGHCAAMTCQSLDLATDPSNCGGYGLACPAGSSCQGGCCVASQGACPQGKTSARGECDDARCVWQSCTEAVRDQACSFGSLIGICCGTACIDPSVDSDNCGACGRQCGDGDWCQPLDVTSDPFPQVAGTCVPRFPCDSTHNNYQCTLDGGLGLCCLGQCLGPYNRCGMFCEQFCPDGGDCSDGTCDQNCVAACPSGTACDEYRSSPYGKYCSPLSCAGLQDGMACTRLRAGDPMQCCGGLCIDTNSDSSNCGLCGLQCPSDTACQFGLCLTPVNCAEATSGIACWLGSSLGEGACCGGTCVNWSTDSNCGGCGQTCPSGSSCGVWGNCLTPNGYQVDPIAPSECGAHSSGSVCTTGWCCGGVCTHAAGCSFADGRCDAGSDCRSGEACLDGRCFANPCPLDSDGAHCPFGFNNPYGTCCSGNCVNVEEDPNNCGACGVSCGVGTCGGLCLPAKPDIDCPGGCPPDSLCARGLCVDSFCESPLYNPTDVPPADLNIGSPGGPWFYPYNIYGPFFCVAPTGQLGLCGPGGECADLASDPLNCGGFGFACPAGQTCQHGACSGSPSNCGIGQIGRFCNLDAGTSYICCPGVGCIDTSQDAQNCGRCGALCPEGQTCNAGVCR
jgi:hypothetical protein